MALENQHVEYHRSTDYVDEMLFSLANLYVASEAQAFVGTLSSNWCIMVRLSLYTRSKHELLWIVYYDSFLIYLSHRSCIWNARVETAGTSIFRWTMGPRTRPAFRNLPYL